MEKEDPFTPEDMFKFRRAALSLVREDKREVSCSCDAAAAHCCVGS